MSAPSRAPARSAALGAVLVLAACGAGTPQESSPPSGSGQLSPSAAAGTAAAPASGTPAASSEASPTQAAVSGGGEWQPQAAVPPTPGPDQSLGLLDVIEVPAGLVAVGIVGPRNSEPAASVIWTSADGGVTWLEVERMDGVVLGSLSVGEPGVIAIGGGAGVVNAAPISVWLSPDGTDWSAADTAALGTGRFQDAIWLGDRFLAVGHRQDTAGTGQRAPATAAAWTSADGVSWTPAWTDDAEDTFFDGVASVADGLIAVGQRFEPASSSTEPDTPRPTVWHSSDGTAWEPAAIDSEPGQILRLAASDSGLIAVGFVDRPPQRALGAWTSTDGITWSLVAEVAEESAGDLRGAVVLADRLVAVGGTEGASDTDARPIVVTGPLP